MKKNSNTISMGKILSLHAFYFLEFLILTAAAGISFYSFFSAFQQYDTMDAILENDKDTLFIFGLICLLLIVNLLLNLKFQYRLISKRVTINHFKINKFILYQVLPLSIFGVVYLYYFQKDLDLYDLAIPFCIYTLILSIFKALTVGTDSIDSHNAREILKELKPILRTKCHVFVDKDDKIYISKGINSPFYLYDKNKKTIRLELSMIPCKDLNELYETMDIKILDMTENQKNIIDMIYLV